MSITHLHQQILRLTVPSIISNITVPLLSLVDVGIVGHLGAASYIGAIAIGGMLFSMIYWIFGFLRMGTGGLTSQAYGANNKAEIAQSLYRSLSIAGGIGLLLILLQNPLLHLAFQFITCTPEVETNARLYFSILVWGAPAVLGLYSLTGWFVGMQNAHYPMIVALVQNALNIVSSLFFVFILQWKVSGVATGTLVAQYVGLLLSLWFCFHKYLPSLKYGRFATSFTAPDMRRFFSVNRDIFLRTLCLVAVTAFFTSGGAAQGDIVLAVNSLLIQLFMLFSYVMDGFAYSGEALGGRFVGEQNKSDFSRLTKLLFIWGFGLSTLFTMIYGFGGLSFLHLLTSNNKVLIASHEYLLWAVAIPFAGFTAFLMDGLFIGATATHEMLLAMFIAACAFFGVYFGTVQHFGNHALWGAFIVYLLLRGIISLLLFKRVKRKSFNS